jgi:uroporphyrinogen-III decarboxylase
MKKAGATARESEMTSRERLLAALRGQPVDRVPWSPFLTYWWDAQPEARQNQGQIAYCREIGADALLRGANSTVTCSDVLGLREVPLGECYNFTDDLPGCTIKRTTDGKHKYVLFETPVGKLSMTLTHSPKGNTWFVTEHQIRSKEDYKILQYMVERMKIEPFYGPVDVQLAELGNDGLTVPVVSPFLKTPFQSFVEHFAGIQKLVYDLNDFPETVDETLAVMSEKARAAVRIAAESPAELFISWEDSSTTSVSPELFTKYIVPEINAWGEILHRAGKMLVHHACGHVKDLLPMMAAENIDAVESVSPPPTGNIEIWDAQKAIDDRVALIGGIEPVKFATYEGDVFEGYIREILQKTDRRHFILANSDSCPPEVSEEKFRKISRIVREREYA